MTRRELAQRVFNLLKKETELLKDKALWRAIAETDDGSLLMEYERIKSNRTADV